MFLHVDSDIIKSIDLFNKTEISLVYFFGISVL